MLDLSPLMVQLTFLHGEGKAKGSIENSDKRTTPKKEVVSLTSAPSFTFRERGTDLLPTWNLMTKT